MLPYADLLLTSLTKSFSGYADVMAGSVVLNPLSRFHAALAALFAARFHNELFAGDATVLLANSADYLARSAVLNRNAAALATHLASSSSSAIKKVLYPSLSDTAANYAAVLRPATSDFPNPGYGCLLSLDFHTGAAARAFYDAFPAHNGPHLGAHRMLAMPFNAVVLGKSPEAVAYHSTYGVGVEQVRISVGLEDEAEVIAAADFALEAAERVYRGVGAGGVAEVEAVALGTSANFD